MVAQDPREYLATLRDLQALPEARQRFTIDNMLKRYEHALANLLRAGPCTNLVVERRNLDADMCSLSDAAAHRAGDDAFPECVQYCVRHRLYQPCLRLLRDEPARAKVRIALHCAD